MATKNLMVLASILLLSACGGGSGGTADNASTLVPDGTGNGVPADNIATNDLQQNAANFSARALGLRTNEITDIVDGTSGMDSSGASDNLETPQGSVSDNLDTNTDDIINNSLGLGPNSMSTVTRDGNIITIDPDDASICEAESDPDEESALGDCLQIVQNITVEIQAFSEDTGVITYFYKNEPLLLIGYSPTTGSYEVKLATLRTFAIDINTNEPGEDLSLSFPETFTGAIRLSVTALEGVADEAGTMSLEVTETMVITDSNEGINASLAPSTILSLATDPGTGNGSIEFDLGALQATAPDDNQDVGQVILPGVSGRAEITNDGGQLIVSNLGLARGPLTVSINSGEAVRLALETFGFSVSEENGEIVLDGNLSLSGFLDNTMGIDDHQLLSYQAMLEVAAPAGTTFLGQSNGSTKIVRGGPFSISLSESDELTAFDGTFIANAGNCFREPLTDFDAPYELVPCDP